jgi:hypothetical protein
VERADASHPQSDRRTYRPRRHARRRRTALPANRHIPSPTPVASLLAESLPLQNGNLVFFTLFPTGADSATLHSGSCQAVGQCPSAAIQPHTAEQGEQSQWCLTANDAPADRHAAPTAPRCSWLCRTAVLSRRRLPRLHTQPPIVRSRSVKPLANPPLPATATSSGWSGPRLNHDVRQQRGVQFESS